VGSIAVSASCVTNSGRRLPLGRSASVCIPVEVVT